MSSINQESIIFEDAAFPFQFVQHNSSKFAASSETRWHEAIEIKYIHDGSVTVMIDTDSACAKKGEIIFVNPYEVHSNLPRTGENGDYHLFMLSLDFFDKSATTSLDLRHLIFEKRIRFKNHIQNPRAAQILSRIAEEMQVADDYTKIAVKGLWQEFFAVLLRSETLDAPYDTSFADRIRFYKSIEPAVIKLREDYQNNYTGEMLANMCNMNRYHFSRIFKRAMGMTVVQYQNMCRLHIADILLKDGSLSVSEIAHHVGIDDEAYFSRLYKRHKGIPPKVAKSILSK